jgi:hypothetical protein
MQSVRVFVVLVAKGRIEKAIGSLRSSKKSLPLKIFENKIF